MFSVTFVGPVAPFWNPALRLAPLLRSPGSAAVV